MVRDIRGNKRREKYMNVTRTKAKNWLHNVLSTVMAQNI